MMGIGRGAPACGIEREMGRKGGEGEDRGDGLLWRREGGEGDERERSRGRGLGDRALGALRRRGRTKGESEKKMGIERIGRSPFWQRACEGRRGSREGVREA